MEKIKYFTLCGFLLIGCKDKTSLDRSIALPDNMLDDRPIILKEGQAVVLVPEGKSSIMIGATVIDGNLVISEISTGGKSLSVTWKNENSFFTSVTEATETQTTIISDENGDGIPDLRTLRNGRMLQRFRLENPNSLKLHD